MNETASFTRTTDNNTMAHMHTAEVVIRDQQSYAKHHDIPGVFEGLTIALLYKKPDDPIGFIAEEAKRMGESKSYEAASPGREVDTQAAAVKYLDDNNVHAIFEDLFTALLYHQPANPLQFIVSECARLAKERARQQPTSPFTEADLRAMHTLFDPSGTGVVTPAQVATAFRNLGLKAAPPQGLPAKVDVEAFVKAAQAAIAAEKVL